MQIILFHKIHDIKNKLLIIIHADKDEGLKRDNFFSHTKPQVFSRALHFKTKGHLMMYFHRRPHCQTRANNLFTKKENNQGVARFQKQIVLDSHQINFCFQNARSRFQDSF